MISSTDIDNWKVGVQKEDKTNLVTLNFKEK